MMTRRNKSDERPSESLAPRAKRSRLHLSFSAFSVDVDENHDSASASLDLEGDDDIGIQPEGGDHHPSDIPFGQPTSLAKWVIYRNKPVLIPHWHFNTDRQHDFDCQCDYCTILNSHDTVVLKGKPSFS